MEPPTIIYCGPSGLEASVLTDYFSKLGCSVRYTETAGELVHATRAAPNPLIILTLSVPTPTLIQLSRQLVCDPASAFPHIFILSDEPFDAQLEAITVITGKSKLPTLASYVLAFLRSLAPGN